VPTLEALLRPDERLRMTARATAGSGPADEVSARSEVLSPSTRSTGWAWLPTLVISSATATYDRA
jgi:hypothetical protein